MIGKRLSFFLLVGILSLFCSACGQDTPPEQLKRVADSTSTVPAAEKQRLLQIVEGGWVDTGLAGAIARNRAVRSAFTGDAYQMEMCFDISNLSGDTLINSRGRLNYNEGERFDLVFRNAPGGKVNMEIDDGRNYTAAKLQLLYNITGKDTLLLIPALRGKNLPGVFKRVFRKPPVRNEVDITALEYLVNKSIFEGRYIPSVNQPRGFSDTLVFEKDGTVKGIGGFTWYRVETDFGSHQAAPFDMLMLSNETGNLLATYAYQRKGNELFLFETENNSGTGLPRKGKLYAVFKVAGN